MIFDMTVDAGPNTTYGPSVADALVGRPLTIRTSLEDVGDVRGLITAAKVQDGRLTVTVDTGTFDLTVKPGARYGVSLGPYKVD